METLANRLKEQRLRMGLTQAQVANHIGISTSAYTQYETLKTQPSLDTLIKLANLFMTSTDYLLGRY